MRLRAQPAGPLTGTAAVPGDKSLSHRALLLAAMAIGESRIEGLLEGADVQATAAALGRLGVDIVRAAPGRYCVHGVGTAGFAEPDGVLDLGNAGTGARLLLGLLAGHPSTTFVTGDDSLRARPMRRVIEPLGRMGARVQARSRDRLPLAITGTTELIPIEYRSEVASAQVKSAVLLAGLHAPGRTTVIEPAPSRDHTERLLRHLGAEVDAGPVEGGHAVAITGQTELAAAPFRIPGDISSAAFPLVAASVIAGSRVRVEGVGVNPLRTGVVVSLNEMGAALESGASDELGGEPVTWLQATAGPLCGIDVPAERAPRMIDEYPILAIAAACAEGTTTMTGIGELRLKESDRLAAMADGLRACGVAVEVGADHMTVQGCGGPPPGGAEIDARLDHRIAMSFLVLGCAARAPVTVAGAETIETSFPGFQALMNRLGARIERVGS